jgi:hypothetical protein
VNPYSINHHGTIYRYQAEAACETDAASLPSTWTITVMECHTVDTDDGEHTGTRTHRAQVRDTFTVHLPTAPLSVQRAELNKELLRAGWKILPGRPWLYNHAIGRLVAPVTYPLIEPSDKTNDDALRIRMTARRTPPGHVTTAELALARTRVTPHNADDPAALMRALESATTPGHARR